MGIEEAIAPYIGAIHESVKPVRRVISRPKARVFTADQLANEVQAIYATLVMVEKRCVESDRTQFNFVRKHSDKQQQTLVAHYETFPHEHHDSFSFP